MVVEEVLYEFGVLQAHGEVAAPSGGMQDRGGEAVDPEQEALRLAESLVFGYPSRAADPTHPREEGRFCKSFPLEYPMGIADMYEWRPKPVSQPEYVQHMLRLAFEHVMQGIQLQGFEIRIQHVLFRSVIEKILNSCKWNQHIFLSSILVV